MTKIEEQQYLAESNYFDRERSLLNLKIPDLELNVYRVFNIEYLINIFKTQKNTLVKPSLWDDPFENFLFKQDNLGKRWKFNQYRERFYGQCWTMNTSETDALWRIYSPMKNGVRVKTTLKKLHETFYDLEHFYPSTHFFVGKVSYKNESEIINFFENPELLEDYLGEPSNSIGHAKSLFLKRKEFEHENEVRLIRYVEEDEYDLANSIYNYQINPFEVFEELLFDPRHPIRYYEKDKDIFQELGFKGDINKSSLYELPKLKIFF